MEALEERLLGEIEVGIAESLQHRGVSPLRIRPPGLVRLRPPEGGKADEFESFAVDEFDALGLVGRTECYLD